MQRILGILFFLVLLTSSALGAFCPDKVDLKEGSCRALCEKIAEETGKGGTVLASVYGTPSSNMAIPTYCTCVFNRYIDKDAGNAPDNLESTLVCTYALTNKYGGIGLKVQDTTDKNNLRYLDISLPNYLVRVFLFDKTVKDVAPALIQNTPLYAGIQGFYTIYLKVLKGFSIFMAYIILVVVLSWHLISHTFKNWNDIMRNPGSSFQNLLSATYKGKALQVIPVMLFFSLPLPPNITGSYVNPTVKQEKIDPVAMCSDIQTLVEECKNEAQDYKTIYCDNEDSGGSLGDIFDDLLCIITGECSITDLFNKLSVQGSFEALCGSTMEQQCEELAQEYDNCIKKYEDLAKKMEDKPKYEWADPDISTINTPLALTMMRNFILWGVDVAEHGVTPYVNTVVTNIFLKTMTYDGYAYSYADISGRLNYESLAKAVDEAWRMPVFYFMSDSGAQMYQECRVNVGGQEVVISSCADLDKYDQASIEMARASHIGACDDVFWTLDQVCPQLKKYKLMAQDIKKNETESNEEVEKLLTLINSTKDQYGFLAPAIIPMYSIFYFIDSIPGIRTSVDPIIATKVGEKNYPLNSPGLTDYLAKAYGFGKSVAGGIGSAVTTAARWLKAGAESVYGFMTNGNPVEKIDRIAGTITSEVMYYIGKALILLSLPFVNNILKIMNDILSGVLTTVNIGLAGLAGVVTATVLSVILGIGGKIYIYILAYSIAIVLLKLMPFIITGLAVIVRFVQYLLELFVLVILLPFYAVAAATNQPNMVLRFFMELYKMTFYPAVLTISAGIALAFSRIIFLFTYYIPTHVILGAIDKGGSSFIESAKSIPSAFLSGVLDGSFLILSTIVATILAWQIGYSLPDYILDGAVEIVGASRIKANQVFQRLEGPFSGLVGTRM
ncbi:hypothetical protein [Desulfurobacterium sp.]|uniref:hypothetical protein n=1 Tax=Desulfurobacterium sp. TaxID=2004706 RepID=UPI00261CCA28|nr:hypothetical protein [Desulfurobacterium sp.]